MLATSSYLFSAYRWMPSTPQARYSSIWLMVYSIPAALKLAFLPATSASNGSLSNGFGKIQFLEMISQSLRRVAALTDAAHATAFNSGMAAISNTLMALAAQGKNIVDRKSVV